MFHICVMPRFAAFVAAFVATLSQRGLVAAESLECYDAVPGDEPCYSNLLWAKNTGIKTNPEFYENYSFLDENSPMSHFQYVLWSLTSRSNKGVGWNCTKPCTYSVKILPGAEVASNVNAAGGLMSMITTEAREPGSTTAGPTTTTMSSGSSLPWWAWCLLAALLVCLCGTAALVVSMLSGGKKRGPSKKKRATNVTPTPAPASVAELYMPTAQLAQPATTYAAPPGYTAVPTAAPVPMQYAAAAPVEQRSVQMAPMVATLPPIATANGAYAPVSMQAPAPMALPIVQPMVLPSAQPATNLFDRLDSNHDGTISRAEFAALGFR
mmetsp:Transcript_49422/g.138405  ORF Transcript_49422/g.138405 Transcript_49422/m.138405 type:complete len:324 (-) Transcript_49422:104-1075(-)